MTLYHWSRTAATNSNSDATMPFPVGMSPSAVGSGVRGAMAAVAKYRDDIAGITTTGGTSTAYTYSSFQVFDTLANMNGAMIAFTPHTTNGATVTLNVDGLGAKPLRSAPSVELPAAVIVQGTPYAATYNNATGEWILHGFFGNPYNIPLGGWLGYTGNTTPNSSFILPQGNALSRTTYAAYFALVGTTYGAGDGSTTFNAPDGRGRVDIMPDGGIGRFPGMGLGSVGGAPSISLTLGMLPTGITSSGSNTISVNSSAQNVVTGTITSAVQGTTGTFQALVNGTATSGAIGSSGANTINVTSNNTGGSTTPTVPPYLGINKILRII